jgi:hypothetical protein
LNGDMLVFKSSVLLGEAQMDPFFPYFLP